MSAKLANPAVRAGILALVAIVIAMSLAVPLRSFVRQSGDNAALAAEIADKERNIAELQSEIDNWNDEAYVEAQARARLSYVFPGETGYVVVDEGGSSDSRLPEKSDDDFTSGSWYERFWASVEDAR